MSSMEKVSKKHRQGAADRRPSRAPSSNDHRAQVSAEDTTGEISDGEGGVDGAKQGINCIYCNCVGCNRCWHFGLPNNSDLLQQCLLFWQEHLPLPKKIFKA